MADGLRIKLSRIRGVTPRTYLTKPYYFQCPPIDEFSIPNMFEHTNYMTIKKGEFSKRGGRLLRTATFDTLVVWYAPWTVHTLPGNLDDMKDRLEVIVNRGWPIRFQASATGFKTNPDGFWADWPATLRGFTPSERAGEPDARYFNCEFVEWRDPTVNRGGKVRTGGRDFPLTHHVKDGDTLYSIAKKYYGPWGGASRWRWVANANGIKNWGPGTNLAKNKHVGIGAKLRIPEPKMTAATLGRPSVPVD